MFPVDLDHLNILIMLILAFFSFKAYNSNSLAIQYEPEQENVQAGKKQADQTIQNVDQKPVETFQMQSQKLENIHGNKGILVPQKVQTVEENQIDIENDGSQQWEIQQRTDQNTVVEAIVTYSLETRVDGEPTIVNLSEEVEKDQDQESTLLNKIQNGLCEEPCDQEDVEVCSSSSDGSSSSGSSSSYPDLSSDEEKCSSQKQKRKQIQKTKRKLKRNLRKEQRKIENSHVEAIEIQ